jgi:hypothetical protein
MLAFFFGKVGRFAFFIPAGNRRIQLWSNGQMSAPIFGHLAINLTPQ